jgi:hypothetical protein
MNDIKIKDIIDDMEMQSNEYRSYLNKIQGVIISVSNEDLSIAEESEEDENFSEYPDWQQDSIKEALNIIENWDNYVALPDTFEIHEYSIMEKFSYSVNNDKTSNALQNALHGRGAFRRFKDAIIRYNIENSWYKFKEEEYKKIAIRWCENHNISYIK